MAEPTGCVWVTHTGVYTHTPHRRRRQLLNCPHTPIRLSIRLQHTPTTGPHTCTHAAHCAHTAAAHTVHQNTQDTLSQLSPQLTSTQPASADGHLHLCAAAGPRPVVFAAAVGAADHTQPADHLVEGGHIGARRRHHDVLVSTLACRSQRHAGYNYKA